MLKYRLVIILNFIILNLSAQNLVLNPSFELLNVCESHFPEPQCAPFPTSPLGVLDWTTPSYASPDVFCSGWDTCFYPPQYDEFRIPVNQFGNQQPHSGGNYAGFYAYDDNIYPIDTREYIQGVLLSPLLQNKKYCVQFYISLSDISYYAIKTIGLNFSNTERFFQIFYLPINLIPHIENNHFIKDTIGWTLVSMEYIANGGEQSFILGNFRTHFQTDTLTLNWPVPSDACDTYYYIDDVSITFCDTIHKAQAGRDTAFCNGGSTILGSHNFSDYHYKWAPSNGLDNDTLANPFASPSVTTTYTLELKDFFDTLTYDTVVVYVHNCANAGNNKITCGKDSVQIGSTAIANCTYHWQPINGLNNAQIAMPKALPNVSTSYTLTLIDNTGFPSTDEVVVQVLQHCDTANAGADTLICLGTTANIGTTPIQNANYLWLPNMGLSSNTIANPMASPPVTTNYILSFTDSLGFTTLDTLLITVVFCDTANAGPDTTICKEKQIILGTHNLANSHYQWSPSNGLNNAQIANPIASPEITTTYSLLFTDSLNNTTQDNLIITIIPCEPANAGADQSICPNQSIELGTHNYAGYTYTWSPINGLDNANIANPTAAPVGNITYTLTVLDLLQTLSTDEVQITIKDCDTTKKEIIIPNVFTPNNDGYNDYFFIENIRENTQLIIFNRWGNMVFESNNYNNTWDAQNVSAGVYYYVLKLANGDIKQGVVEVFK